MDKKKLIISISLLAVLGSCKNQPFKGFLVCKEFIPGHMDDEHAKNSTGGICACSYCSPKKT